METSTKGNQGRALTLRILLACGAVAPLFFIIVFLVEGATRSNYDPMRHPVSSLSIGDLGWIQAVNFIITGLLLLAFAIGLRFALHPGDGSFWGPVLFGLVGIGLTGAGFFTTDPLNGYPPGTPLVPTVTTLHGTLHNLFSLPVFVCLPIACFIFSRIFFKLGEPGWAIYSIFAGLAMLAAFVLAGMGFQQSPGFTDSAGLFQRISIIIGFTWITLFADHSSRTLFRNSDNNG
ncbi:MAG: DUF998 domain-containing protein [Anaerolineales bacterium]|jgi:hypothetical membrane protein